MRRALFSCFCGLLWISSGWAADPLGTININLHGNVVDFSCTVNTADIDKTVDLGRWPTTQLLNAGDTTALVPFSLRLEGCPPGSVAILFTGTPEELAKDKKSYTAPFLKKELKMLTLEN